MNLQYISLAEVIPLLENILSIDEPFKIHYDKKSDLFIFNIDKYNKCEFRYLPQGYQHLLNMVSDLIYHISIRTNNFKEHKATVIIDIIETFLHPKLQYVLVDKFRKTFPNIQWIISTHSPTIIQGASEDAVFYKIFFEKENVEISEQWKCGEINNWKTNTLTTSQSFGMETARMRTFNETQNLDTNNNYYYSRIDKMIQQELKQQKINGKQYFSENEIEKSGKTVGCFISED